MQRFQHLSGMAAIALTALGLSACYPPPPGTVAVAPTDVTTALPPQPPPYYVPPAAATPFFTAWAWRMSAMLQGAASFQQVATPTKGWWICSRVSPMA